MWLARVTVPKLAIFRRKLVKKEPSRGGFKIEAAAGSVGTGCIPALRLVLIPVLQVPVLLQYLYRVTNVERAGKC
jgi:hypothetical protein